MPKKRHTPEQIAAALRQADAGTPIAEITRKLGVHENTFYHWKKRYAQLGTPEIRELRPAARRELQAQTARRRSDAGQDDAAGRALKKVVKPAARRVFFGHLRERYQISERRVCIATRFCRASVRYRGKLSAFNGALLARIKEIAAARIRYGYRRVHVLLQREGWPVNVKRVARLYRAEGLSLRKKKNAQAQKECEHPSTAHGRDGAQSGLEP